jgi:Holliday junction resolvase RusA-like endonuclease
MTWTVIIPGPPVAKERPRRSAFGHWYTPRRTTEYEEAVAWAAIAAGVRLDPYAAYSVVIELFVADRRKDLDNCAKSILDGLQRMGDGWDDRQVTSLMVRKRAVESKDDEQAVVRIARRPD